MTPLPPNVAAYLTSLVMAGSLFVLVLPANLPVFAWINGHHARSVDGAALVVTMLGDGLPLLMGLLVLARRSLGAAVAAVTSLAAAGAIVQTAKFIHDVPRPVAIVEGTRVIGPILRAYSFPSGHAAAGFAVAGVLLLLARRRFTGPAVLVLAGAIAYSRVYVGVHFPADVTMGALLGLLAAGGVVRWGRRPIEFLDRWGEAHALSVGVAAALLYAGTAVFLFGFYDQLAAPARTPLMALAAVGILPLACKTKTPPGVRAAS